MLRRLTLLVAVLAATALPAAAGPGRGAAAPAGPSALTWAPCEGIDGVECATIQVPVDHANPAGGQFALRIGRVPNTDAAQRRGTLMIIPGGPGPGIERTLADSAAAYHLDEVRRYYDVVSFDPRGIGASNPIRCDPEQAPPVSEPPTTPPTLEEFEAIARANEAFFRSCFELTGELMGHLSAKDTAADIESIRQALRASDGLVAYGGSYGSSYGAAYVEDYGENVKTMVIDGVVDHTVDLTTFITRNIVSVQESFDRFARWCGREAACALHGRDVTATFDEAIAADPRVRRLVSQFLAAGNDPDVGWPLIASMLAEVVAGETALLEEMAEIGGAANSATAPDEDPTLVSGRDGLFLGVLCNDWGPQDDYAAFAEASETVSRIASRFAFKFWDPTPRAHATASVAGCIGWPEEASNPPHPLTAGSHPNVMVATATYDPPTPLTNAMSVWLQIPEARLHIAEADGHQSWIVSRCAYEVQLAFLLDPTSAQPTTVCPGDDLARTMTAEPTPLLPATR